eukprot:6213882-Pleurochrysis_carterae.AAC.2
MTAAFERRTARCEAETQSIAVYGGGQTFAINPKQPQTTQREASQRQRIETDQKESKGRKAHTRHVAFSQSTAGIKAQKLLPTLQLVLITTPSHLATSFENVLAAPSADIPLPISLPALHNRSLDGRLPFARNACERLRPPCPCHAPARSGAVDCARSVAPWNTIWSSGKPSARVFCASSAQRA